MYIGTNRDPGSGSPGFGARHADYRIPAPRIPDFESLAPFSVIDPFNKPLPRFPILDQPADRAAFEGDVPLVLIPTQGFPPATGRAPRPGRLLHDAAGHAAAIDRGAGGPAGLDGHANRDRR